MSEPAAIRVTYVGHASVLIELDGVRVLTDPVLRGAVGHLRRVVPAPRPEHLADIDLVLVSHAHHDHLDVPSLRSLPGSPPVVCPASAVGPVRAAGLAVEALEVGAVVARGEISIEATPADHDGRRWPLSRSGEAEGFVLRGESGASVYFAGDTGLFDAMAALGPLDLALLPVAGWGPKLGPGHLDPPSAARAAAMLAPRVAVPIHWGTYERVMMRSGEERDGPPRQFAAELAELAPEVEAVVLEPGESVSVG